MDLKEAVMAKNKDKMFSKVAETAKESDIMRMRRIDGSQNGATLRTRVVRDKTKYNRNLKHKKSFADAGDFPFFMGCSNASLPVMPDSVGHLLFCGYGLKKSPCLRRNGLVHRKFGGLYRHKMLLFRKIRLARVRIARLPVQFL